jgi:hypothetical protein
VTNVYHAGQSSIPWFTPAAAFLDAATAFGLPNCRQPTLRNARCEHGAIMAKKDPNSEPSDSVFQDPFTGTKPVGPVQTESADAAPTKDQWSMAAKWFVMGLLLLAVVFLVGYLMP